MIASNYNAHRFEQQKKEPVDGSRTRLALQNTADAALYCSRGFHQYQGV
jgi:hypothetical protein